MARGWRSAFRGQQGGTQVRGTQQEGLVSRSPASQPSGQLAPSAWFTERSPPEREQMPTQWFLKLPSTKNCLSLFHLTAIDHPVLGRFFL